MSDNNKSRCLPHRLHDDFLSNKKKKKKKQTNENEINDNKMIRIIGSAVFSLTETIMWRQRSLSYFCQ